MAERTRSPRNKTDLQLPIKKDKDKDTDKESQDRDTELGPPAPSCPTGMQPELVTPDWTPPPDWIPWTYAASKGDNNDKDKDENNDKDKVKDTSKDTDKDTDKGGEKDKDKDNAA